MRVGKASRSSLRVKQNKERIIEEEKEAAAAEAATKEQEEETEMQPLHNSDEAEAADVIEEEEPGGLRRTRRVRVKTKLYSAEEESKRDDEAKKKKEGEEDEASPSIRVSREVLAAVQRLRKRLGLAGDEAVIVHLLKLLEEKEGGGAGFADVKESAAENKNKIRDVALPPGPSPPQQTNPASKGQGGLSPIKRSDKDRGERKLKEGSGVQKVPGAKRLPVPPVPAAPAPHPPASSAAAASDAPPVPSRKRRRRPRPTKSKQNGSTAASEGGASQGASDQADDPSEKILKRKRIGQYDCRKTPSHGLPQTVSPSSEAADAEAKKEDVEMAEDPAEAPSVNKSAGGGGLPPYSLSPKWCRNCDCRHESGPETCPLRTPAANFTDSVIDFSSSSGKGGAGSGEDDGESAAEQESKVPPEGLDLSKSFAQLSLPSPLQLVEREPGQGLCVAARIPVAARTQFGPMQGEKILERDVPEDFDMKDLWQVFTEDNRRLYLSTVNPEKSNWLRYLRPAPQRKQRNVAAVVKQNDRLYFVTVRDVAEGEELVYWIDDPDLMWTKKRAEKKNCGGCNARFCHPLYYRLHCTIFHDPQFSLTIRKYHCKVCGLAVLGKDNIVKHAMAEHGGKGAYQCQYCKKYFLRLNYLDMHRTYGCSSNPSRTRPLCDLCGKKFCQPQKLKIHMKRMHSDNANVLNELRCNLCSKLLGSKNALQRHRREVHSDLASESGNSCVSSVSNSSSSNNNNLAAMAASVATAASSSSSAHQAGGQQDAASARVACEKCGRTFKNKSNLKIHMLTHSGIKPFGCKIDGCRTGFTTKQCLQFHYRKAHGLTDEQMPKIEREIPYTLKAYSGGMLQEPRLAQGGSAGPEFAGTRARRVKRTKQSRSTPPAAAGSAVTSSESKNSGDVYHFEEDEEEKTGPDQAQRKEESKEDDDDSVQRERTPSTNIDGEKNSSNKAGLLVLAALNAAEQDMKGSQGDDEDDGSTVVKEENPVERSGDGKDTTTPSHAPSSFLPEDKRAATGGVSSLSHSAQSLIGDSSSSSSSSQLPPLPSSCSSSAPLPPPGTPSGKDFLPPISSIASSKVLPPPELPPASSSASSSSYNFNDPLPPYSSLYYPGLDLPPASRSGQPPSYPPPPPRSTDYPYPGRQLGEYPPPLDATALPPPAGLEDIPRPPPPPHASSLHLPPPPAPPHPFDPASPQHFPPLPSLHPKEHATLPPSSDRDYSNPFHPQGYPPPPPPPPPPASSYNPSSARLPPPPPNPYPSPAPAAPGRLPPLTSTPPNPYHPYGYY